MSAYRVVAACVMIIALNGCSGLVFYDRPVSGALNYYDTVPYLFVQTTADCTSTATVIGVPGLERSVGFRSGYGSANLAVNLSAGGMVSSVNQTTDTKIPETIAAVSQLATAAGSLKIAAAPPKQRTKQLKCQPTAGLYAIQNGAVATKPLTFPVIQESFDSESGNAGPVRK